LAEFRVAELTRTIVNAYVKAPSRLASKTRRFPEIARRHKAYSAAFDRTLSLRAPRASDKIKPLI